MCAECSRVVLKSEGDRAALAAEIGMDGVNIFSQRYINTRIWRCIWGIFPVSVARN